MTVSTPVKIVALAGLAIALGLGGLLLLTSKHAAATPPAAAAPPVTHSPSAVRHVAAAPKAVRAVVHKKAVPHKAKPALRLNPLLPVTLRQALLHKPVAVVVVYSSHSALDRDVLAEARAGARTAHAGFVAENVALEPVAAAVATWSSTVMDPEVLIVRRPGNVAFTVSGPTDRDTVAQAAATAK